MAKATKKTSRVSPPVPTIKVGIMYDELVNGECFIWKGCLMMKYDIDDQEAFNLDGSEYKGNMCNEIIIPVDIKVTWTRK